MRKGRSKPMFPTTAKKQHAKHGKHRKHYVTQVEKK